MKHSLQDATARPAAGTRSGRRLVEVDALRGIAAVAVMLFHYTTRFDDLFIHTTAPLFNGNR